MTKAKLLRQAEMALKEWCERMSLRRRLQDIGPTQRRMLKRWNDILDGPDPSKIMR